MTDEQKNIGRAIWLGASVLMLMTLTFGWAPNCGSRATWEWKEDVQKLRVENDQLWQRLHAFYEPLEKGGKP